MQPAPETNAAAQPTEPQPKPEKTPEQLAAEARAHVAMQFVTIGDKERKRLAISRGLMDKEGNISQRGILLAPKLKDGQVTLEALRQMVPLPGDTMRYAKDKHGKKRMATDRYGFVAFPKQSGRRKPHMSRHAHTIKNKSIAIFKTLFKLQIAEGEAAAKAKGETYNGIPTEELTKLGARAATLGNVQATAARKLHNRRARRRQQLSRRINYGIQPRNTNVQAYIGVA